MIENTSRRDPAIHLMGSLAEGTDAYITGMESAGQTQLVNSQQLPVDGWGDDILALGIERGEDVDDLFCKAIIPDGWSRRRSDHAMWSHLVDERGVKRVAIFYKAAFYDRHASMHVEDPGASLATDAIYGEGPAALPDAWPVLTDDEKADFRASLSQYLTRADEYPHVYADRVPRVQQLIQLTA